MNHYEVLGVAPAAGEGELRRAYLAKARQHHPDAGGDDRSMTRLNQAWAVLSDPEERRRYDATLGVRPRSRSTVGEPIVVDTDGGARLPFDADLDDLFDARPYSPLPTRQGSLALVPPGIFVGSVFVGSVALVFDSPALLGGAVLLFVLSCVAIAVVAMLTLRSGARRR